MGYQSRPTLLSLPYPFFDWLLLSIEVLSRRRQAWLIILENLIDEW